MKHNSAILFLMCLNLYSFSQQHNISSKEFNINARDFFLNRVEYLDLSPLSEEDKCILKATVTNDLDKLNSWQIVTIDDIFLIKRYTETYIPLNFGFIFDVSINKHYFLSLPSLEKFIWEIGHNYQKKNDSIFTLKGPVTAERLNTSLLDNFFQNRAFKIDVNDQQSFKLKVQLANRVLETIFKFIEPNEISIEQLLAEVEDNRNSKLLTSSEYAKIANLIDRKFDRCCDLRIIHFNQIGYCVFIFLADDQASRLKFEAYFIPEYERRHPTGREVITEHRECISQP